MDMDMHHRNWQAAWARTSCIDMDMVMQHGQGHDREACRWTHSMNMDLHYGHGHAASTWTYSMDMDMKHIHGHASRTWRWTSTMDAGMPIKSLVQHR
jgi:hypothetical protein